MTVTDLHHKVRSVKSREPTGFRLFTQSRKQNPASAFPVFFSLLIIKPAAERGGSPAEGVEPIGWGQNLLPLKLYQEV